MPLLLIRGNTLINGAGWLVRPVSLALRCQVSASARTQSAMSRADVASQGRCHVVYNMLRVTVATPRQCRTLRLRHGITTAPYARHCQYGIFIRTYHNNALRYVTPRCRWEIFILFIISHWVILVGCSILIDGHYIGLHFVSSHGQSSFHNKVRAIAFRFHHIW